MREKSWLGLIINPSQLFSLIVPFLLPDQSPLCPVIQDGLIQIVQCDLICSIPCCFAIPGVFAADLSVFDHACGGVIANNCHKMAVTLVIAGLPVGQVFVVY